MNFQAAQPDIATLANKHRLDLVVLFGSQATGRTHVQSDVDIAVLSKEDVNRARLALELSELLKRDDVEVVDLRSASPTLMRAVVENGKVLYESRPDAFFGWKLYAIKIWMETAWLRALRNKQLIEWARQHA